MQSVLFFLMWALYTTAADARPDWLQGVIVAVVFGLIMGPLAARRNRHEVAPLLADVAPSHYRQVSKAMRAGLPPNDPAIALAASRLARLRAAQGMRDRKVSVILMAVGVVVLIALAQGHSFHPAGYVVAVLFGALGARSWINPLLLQSRSVILAGAAHQADHDGAAQPGATARQGQSVYPSETTPAQDDTNPASDGGGLFSFRGRIVTAIFVLAIGVWGLWASFHYSNLELFWYSFFPLALGPISIWDAVNRKRGSLVDVEGDEERAI
ncbi:hypothetical protein DE4585_02636 [Mycobacteroides salmoniphilum]|uniref:Uncharacterized protein n=1 Tax=Mycobacteroides salmoniphilum TaxID=404941 RepID=A0A4R8S3B3_9MYCO|nr:hypothetical protein DE4585_02636 [Mycobacteroides salmoniphilum]